MSEELKACPFCGGGAELIKRDHNTFFPIGYKYKCSGCDVSSLGYYNNIIEAEKSWNTRADDKLENNKLKKVDSGYETSSTEYLIDKLEKENAELKGLIKILTNEVMVNENREQKLKLKQQLTTYKTDVMAVVDKYINNNICVCGLNCQVAPEIYADYKKVCEKKNKDLCFWDLTKENKKYILTQIKKEIEALEV